MPSLRAAALGAALLATAASGILAQTARPPAVNTKPVYCWEGNAIFNITSQTAESVCADLYIVSPPNNPISEYWETRLTIEGVVLRNESITNIWRFDPVPGSPGSAMDTSVITQYKVRSWDQLVPNRPFRAISLCGIINWSHYGFTASRTIISSDGGRICEGNCAAPLNRDFGSGCVWGNWSDTGCQCECNPGFCRNQITGQCTVQQAWDSLANRPQSCLLGTGIQLDPSGQPVATPAVAPVATAPASAPKTKAVKSAKTAAAAPTPAAAAPSTAAPKQTPSSTSQTSPAIIVVTTATSSPEVTSKGLSTAAIAGMIDGACAILAILVGFVVWRRVKSDPAAKTLTTIKEDQLEEGKKGGNNGSSATLKRTNSVASPRSAKISPETTTFNSSVVTMSRVAGSPARSPAAAPAAAPPTTSVASPIYSPLYEITPNAGDARRMSGVLMSGDESLMSESLIPSEGATSEFK